MYGLQNILTDQGFTIEQQRVILELIGKAGFLESLNLLLNLRHAGFNTDQINRIMQQALNTQYNSSDTFDPDYLLKNLATEDAHLKSMTMKWFSTIVNSVFIERREEIKSHITPTMLQAFAPQPPLPKERTYDTIIVLDSPEQPITDGLDVVSALLNTKLLYTHKIIIPATLSTQTNPTPIGFNNALRAHLPTYLQMHNLNNRVRQDEHLSRNTLADFLIQLYSQEPAVNDTAGMYQMMFLLLRYNRTLIITTQENYQLDLKTIAFVHEALPNCKQTTEIIYTLKRKEFTNDDLMNLLAERLFQDQTPAQTSTAASAAAAAAAAAASTAPSTAVSSTQNGHTDTSQPGTAIMPALRSSSLAIPHAPVENNGPSARGFIAVSIAAAGLFAAANPEATKTVFETVRDLAQAAIRSYMG